MTTIEPTPAQRLRGRFLAGGAALLWSTSGLFAKAPWFDEWPVDRRGLILGFWRACFAAAVLLALVRRPRLSPKLIPMTMLFVAMNYTYLTAMVMTTAANAIWLQHLAPVWVFLIGVYVFREQVQRGDWSMVAWSFTGVAIILAFELRGQQSQGILLGILGGLTYAGVVISIRQLRDFDSAWLIFVNHLVTVLAFAPLVLAHEVLPTTKQFVFLAAFGILQMAVPYVLFANSLRYISGHEASAIVLLEPILTPLWVFLAWRHYPSYTPPSLWTFCGAACILMGLTFRFVIVGRRRAISD